MKSEEFATTQLYADIIDLPHHVSKRHPQMSMWNRAAQFAPFAAISGHDEAIENTKEKNQDYYQHHDDADDETYHLE